MRIPLGTSDYSRTVAEIPDIPLLNRFYEVDPTNQTDQVALLCRPSLRKWLEAGDGPIRAVYSQPGSFDEKLFVVSGTTLYSIEQDETVTSLGTVGGTGAVSMTATAFPYALFIANGLGLQVYTDDGVAVGTLTVSAVANNDTVTIGTTVYKWTTGSVDTGTPAGTLANPWLVNLGADATASLSNLRKAINDTGTPGTTYSTLLTAHTTVQATSSSATTLVVSALASGTGGNAIATTETGAATAWGGVVLAGGGSGSLTPVIVPDDDGIVSVGHIAGFIICVVAQGFEKNGRYYWVEPGELTIDALNFATAERAPDPVWQVVVLGDKFWLPGSSSVEPWYPTGDLDAPFIRQQGILFEQGIWEGTILALKENMMAVGNDGVPYIISPSGPIPVGTPGIVERFRKAINAQRLVA